MESLTEHRRGEAKPLSMAGGAAAFVLTLLFAVFALLAMVSGVSAYNAVAERTERTAQKRDALLYVLGKIRGADFGVDIRVETGENGASDTLILTERLDGTAYETRVWIRDGELTELFAEAEFNDPDFPGEVIGQLSVFHVTLGNPVRVTMTTAQGDTREGAVYLRTKAGDM